jgi:hypothetical protein
MTDTSASPRLGPVDLGVTDPARATAFWRDIVGLPVLESGDPVVLAIRKAVQASGRIVQVGSWQRSDHRFRTAVEMVRVMALLMVLLVLMV